MTGSDHGKYSVRCRPRRRMGDSERVVKRLSISQSASAVRACPAIYGVTSERAGQLWPLLLALAAWRPKLQARHDEGYQARSPGGRTDLAWLSLSDLLTGLAGGPAKRGVHLPQHLVADVAGFRFVGCLDGEDCPDRPCCFPAGRAHACKLPAANASLRHAGSVVPLHRRTFPAPRQTARCGFECARVPG